MSSTLTNILTLRFAYHHFHTEGKLVNTIDALKSIDADHVCLSLTGNVLDQSNLEDRLKRTLTVVHKLRRQGFSCDLVMPSLTDSDPAKPDTKSLLRLIYSQAAQIPVRTIWVDDSHAKFHRGLNRRNLLAWFAAIRRVVIQHHSHRRLGLIAAPPPNYAQYSLTAAELAQALAGLHSPLLAQSQPFTSDYHRDEILQAAQTLALSAAQTAHQPDIRLFGAIDHPHASSFHKSTEATQMQINLNLLYGFKNIILNCFDNVGTAPGSENPYLNMVRHSQSFLRKFHQLLPEKPQPAGIGVVVPENISPARSRSLPNHPSENIFPTLLWRLGLPVRLVTPAQVTDHDDVFILAGSTPDALNRRQIKHIFHHGVLLDAHAAQTLQKMNLNRLMGLKVGRSLKNVQTEIFSDQSFAASFYGQNTVLADHFGPRQFRRLQSDHPNARPITTLFCKNNTPYAEGIVVFDDIKNRNRCAVLPYCLNRLNYAPLLCTSRQRFFQDLFSYLLRRRLSCFVEHAADLVPFYLPMPRKDRLLICLLNVGFDWAIDSRVRLARLPFTVKRLRELDEHGRLNCPTELRLNICRDYQYIQLNSDTAVPPMQMTVLLAEG